MCFVVIKNNDIVQKNLNGPKIKMNFLKTKGMYTCTILDIHSEGSH